MKTTVIRSDHDDWMVTVLLSNGEVFSFNTEMWPEHRTLTDADWPRVLRCAENAALFLSANHCDPYTRTHFPQAVVTREQLYTIVDAACEKMSDDDFRRLVR